MSILNVFAAKIAGATHPFVEGVLYTAVPDRQHYHLSVVRCTETTAIISCTSIIRKVLLYPLSQSESSTTSQQFALVDYLRPKLPITAGDIIIPYVETNYVVMIQGTDDQEWLCHVKKVNVVRKTADVQFLVQKLTGQGDIDQRTDINTSTTAREKNELPSHVPFMILFTLFQ